MISPIALRGIGGRPLAPVHSRMFRDAANAVVLGWTRRARGGWSWPDGVELPLNEQSEAYVVTFGSDAAATASWECFSPTLTISAAGYAALAATAPTGYFAVRQRGARSLSEPLVFPQT